MSQSHLENQPPASVVRASQTTGSKNIWINSTYHWIQVNSNRVSVSEKHRETCHPSKLKHQKSQYAGRSILPLYSTTCKSKKSKLKAKFLSALVLNEWQLFPWSVYICSLFFAQFLLSQDRAIVQQTIIRPCLLLLHLMNEFMYLVYFSTLNIRGWEAEAAFG